MNHTDVLIVGAGPTGLTLACDLARWGINCRIVDQWPEPQIGSRGFTLKPRTLDVLDDLGLVDRVAQAAADHTPIRFYLGEPLLFDLSVPPAQPTPQRPHPNALSLPQWRTEAILRDRLAEFGGKVEFGCRLADLHADDGGVTATLDRDGATETVRAATSSAPTVGTALSGGTSAWRSRGPRTRMPERCWPTSMCRGSPTRTRCTCG